MEEDFSGRVVLITGAARGLGRATAREFAAKRASLFLVDILAEKLEVTRSELAAAGCDVRTMSADIAERDACFAAVSAAVEAFGRLDVLCNIAGIVRFAHLADMPAEEWHKLLAINLSATFFFCQAAIPHLLASHGNIVNVASQTAHVGSAYLAAYSASKAAVVQLTRSMAMEFMHRPIRINVISPGTMHTGIGVGVTQPADIDQSLVARYSGLRPAAEPEDVASLIVFTASDRARSIHGSSLIADCGVSAG